MSDDGTLDGSSSQCLPRLGFDDTTDFDSLVDNNPFLFRVYTPKPHSPSISYDKNIFCLAPRFNTKYSSPVDDISVLSPTLPVTKMATCSDVTRHMDWTTRSNSCYISTSFSFAWAVWEALRRYNTGYKHDVEIAVIDAASLRGRAMTGVQIMEKSSPEERPKNYNRWYQFSQDSQSVLIYGYIPMGSYLSSVSLASIIDNLPTYFLHKHLDDAKQLSDHPLERMAWSFDSKKASFKLFCQRMSEKYFKDSTEVRLQGTIVESVRLALAFLNPWFNERVVNDIQTAVAKVTDLACVIAAWPDPEDPAEMAGVIRGLVTLLANQEKANRQASLVGQVVQLAGVIDELEGVVSALEERLRSQAPSPFPGPHSPTTRAPIPLSTPLRIRIPSSNFSFSSASSPISPVTPSSFEHISLSPGDQKRMRALSLTQCSSSPSRQAFALPNPLNSPKPNSSSVATQTPQEDSFAPIDSFTPRPRNLSLTVSYALTGFFLGTLLTLCIASTQQRRTVLLHLT